MRYRRSVGFHLLIKFIWSIIDLNYERDDSETSEQCGTHIHVSPNGGWHLEDLIEIAKCVIYFESAINALLPAHRQINNWAASNRDGNINFDGMGLEEIFREIERWQPRRLCTTYEYRLRPLLCMELHQYR